MIPYIPPWKKKPFSLMGGYIGDRGAGPMGSGNIEIPHLPPPGQRTSEQSVSGGLPTHRLNQLNRWWDIEKSPNLNKWGSMPSSAGAAPTPFTRRKGGFKRVLKHLAAMESPGPDWSLQAQNVGVRSPWSPTSRPWAAVGENMYGSEQERKKKRYA